MSSTLPPLALVGRTTQRAALHTALDRAVAGRPTCTVLRGPAGSGKSRLLADAIADAAARGFQVAVGRGYAAEAVTPYAIVADALVPLLRTLEPSTLTVLTRGASADLALVLPGVFDTSPADGGDGDRRIRMRWGLLQLLERLAARAPLLVVLDNLQWLDDASLELIQFLIHQLARDGAPRRLLVMAAFTDAAAPTPGALVHMLRALDAEREVDMLELSALSEGDTRELLSGTFSAPPEQVRLLAQRLHTRTQGNPYFIAKTLQSLVESGALVHDRNAWSGWDADARVLPRSIGDALQVRIEELAPQGRELLELIAIAGSSVSVIRLAELSGHAPASLLPELDALVTSGLVVAGEADAYDMEHPIARDAVLHGIPRPRLQLLHARIAQALQSRADTHSDALLDAIAFHASQAGPALQSERTAEFLVRAGHAALRRYADSSAAAYLTAALGRDPAPPLRRAAQALLARAHHRQGDANSATALWTSLHAEGAVAGDDALLAESSRRLGLIAFTAGDHTRALTHLSAAHDAATRASNEDIAVRIDLARAASLQSLGQRSEARVRIEESLSVALRLGDPALLARVHRALVLLNVWTGARGEARAHGERAIALAEESGDAVLSWSAHWAMAVLGGLTGDAASTSHHVRASQRYADQLESPVLRLWSAEVAIEYMSGVGEWPAALALAGQAIPAARALGQHAVLPRLLVWTGLIHRGLGDLAQARVHIEEAWRIAGAEGGGEGLDVHIAVPVHTGMAGLLMTEGDNAGALAVGEAGLALAERSGEVAWTLYRLLPFVIETSLYLEDYERAARWNARLRVSAEASENPLALAWAGATDAILAFLVRHDSASITLLRESADTLRSVPFVFDAARLRRIIGRALAESGDVAGAETELRLAHDEFLRLGAARELRATREQLRALGVRPPSTAVHAGEGSLSAREREIAGLVADRKSNKEIGALLDISSRTVSTHLSNIYQKLGVDSRGALTDQMRSARGVTGGP